jgi:hypothetical protein
MELHQDLIADAKRALDTDPKLAAFILWHSAAAYADADIARLARLHYSEGCSKGDVLGLIRDIEAWNAANAAQVSNAR